MVEYEDARGNHFTEGSSGGDGNAPGVIWDKFRGVDVLSVDLVSNFLDHELSGVAD